MKIKYVRYKSKGVAEVYIANKDLSEVELYCKIDLSGYLDITQYCRSLRALLYIDEEITSLRPDARYVRIDIHLDDIGIFTTGFLHLIYPGNQVSKYLNIIGREIDGLMSSEDLNRYVRNTWYRRLYVSLNAKYVDKIGTELYKYLFNGLSITVNSHEIVQHLQFHDMSIRSLKGILRDTVYNYIKEKNISTDAAIELKVVFYGDAFKFQYKVNDNLDKLLGDLSSILIKDMGCQYHDIYFMHLHQGIYTMAYPQGPSEQEKILQDVLDKLDKTKATEDSTPVESDKEHPKSLSEHEKVLDELLEVINSTENKATEG